MHAYVQEFECHRILGLTRKRFLTSLSYESSQNYFQMMGSLVNWRAMFLALMSPVLPSIRLVSTQPSAATILQKVLRIYVAQYPLSRLTSDSIIYLEVSNIWLVRCMSTRILFLRLAFSLWYLSFLTFLETGRSRDHHSEPDVDVWGIGHNSMQPRLLLAHIF